MQVTWTIPPQESGAEMWARMTGEHKAPPKGYYTVDGWDYWNIYFGIAYPENGEPGAIVTVGVVKEIDDPKIEVRDIVQSIDIMKLYRLGDGIRQMYSVDGGTIGKVWYGEPGRFDGIRAEYNAPFTKDKRDKIHMAIIGGPDGEESVDSGLKYMTTLLDLSRERLSFMDGCDALQAALQRELHTDHGRSDSIAPYDPLVMALGFACRAIVVQKCWRERLPKYKNTEPTSNLWAKGKAPWQVARRKASKQVGFIGSDGKWL